MKIVKGAYTEIQFSLYRKSTTCGSMIPESLEDRTITVYYRNLTELVVLPAAIVDARLGKGVFTLEPDASDELKVGPLNFDVHVMNDNDTDEPIIYKFINQITVEDRIR